MTIIYIVEDNCKNLAVTINSIGVVKIQKIEDLSKNENIIYQVKPIRLFVNEKSYKGTCILLYIGIENNRYNYIHIGADKVYKFQTENEIFDYTYRMGKNLTPYSIALSEKYIYYLSPFCKYTEVKDIIDIRDDDINKLFDYDIISKYENLKINQFHI